MGDLASMLRQAGVSRGDLVGLAVAPDGTVAVAVQGGALTGTTATGDAAAGETASGHEPGGWITTAGEVGRADGELRPRWVTWSGETAARLVEHGVRLATCWDVAAVHRLLFGGWRADPGLAWASLRGLALDGVPSRAPGELFAVADIGAGDARTGIAGWAGDLTAGDSEAPGSWAASTGRATGDSSPPTGDSSPAGGDAGGPIGPGGYLRPEWTDGGWADSPRRLVRWARLALEAAGLQDAARHPAASGVFDGSVRAAGKAGGPLGQAGVAVGGRGVPAGTAHSESTAELLCAELAADGLPVRRAVAEALLTEIIGSRPRDAAEATRIRAARDEQVLRHAPAGTGFGPRADLRSPLQVRDLLKAAGIDVPDTRAWRLEPFRDTHPLVAALLEWRKAERVATTYGYGWLDDCLGADGRLRGSWTGSDGAAGRMTASAGLHNMPATLRQAVIAEDGHIFIRADLGQIEPRVLAAVSGDRALIAATEADDLYLPVARQLGVDRPTAKVAMIAAMYGQTTGHGGQAARRMKAAYPVAMGYLDDADQQAMAGRDLRTYGGRLVRMSGGDGYEAPGRVAARGRYGRNAMIQGAAAELFKMWAVTVRARGAALHARIVLCLHDELLVHVPEDRAEEAAQLVGDCLRETARRWAPRGAAGPGVTSGGGAIRFLADITTVRCWADAKPGTVNPPVSRPPGSLLARASTPRHHTVPPHSATTQRDARLARRRPAVTPGGKTDTVTANTDGNEGA